MSTQQVKASLGYTRSYLKKKVKKGKERKKKGRRKSELEVTEILSKVPSQSPAAGLALWAALVGHLESMGASGKPHLPSQDLVPGRQGRPPPLERLGLGKVPSSLGDSASGLWLLARAVQFMLTTRSPSRRCTWSAITSALLTEILTAHREGLLREASPLLTPAVC